MKKIISTIYSIFIGVPIMYAGYFKDLLASKKYSIDPVRNQLLNTGLYIFEKRLTTTEIDLLNADFKNLQTSKTLQFTGQLNGRIFVAGCLTPLLERYAQKTLPHIKKILNTNKVKVEISYYQESVPSVSVEDVPGGEFHVDDNKANLKFFIYLTDVSEENGPFSCVPGTGTWKLKGSLWRGLLWELSKKRKYLYEYMTNHETCIKLEKKIVGPAGTCFIVDTTSLHRAQPVLIGSRKVAVISFNRVGIFH